MDQFIQLPQDLLKELLDFLNLSQKLSNEVITKTIEEILGKYLLKTDSIKLNRTTNNNLQEPSHIYLFILDCFVDLDLISSSQFHAINNRSLAIKLETLLTKKILSKLYQNLKCCQESITIFQLFSCTGNDDDNKNLLNEVQEFFKKYPQYKNKFGIYGTSVLYAATKYGNLEIVKYLIETVGCQLNLQNPRLLLPNGNELLSNENTPLHGACYFQHLDIVEYLLKHDNIDLNLKNSFCQTPKMIAESNKSQSVLQQLNQFSKKSEMFYIVLNETTNFDEEYGEIVKKFILKDSESIEEIIEENFCDIKNEKQSLVGISNIEQLQWITFAIFKVSKEVFVFFVKDEFSSSYSLCSYERRKDEIVEVVKKNFKNTFSIKVIEKRNREEDDEISNNQGIALALYKMNIIIEFFKDKTVKKEQYNKKFEETNFSIYGGDTNNNKRREIIFDFEKLFVKIGLSRAIRTTETLEKILTSLKNIVKNEKNYVLDGDQLVKLTNFLENRNFTRVNDNEIDLKEIIIEILLQLKNRGQMINNQRIQNNLQNYYEENRSHLNKIQEFDELLHQDARDNQIKGCLIIALDYQKDFLFSIGKLIPALEYFDQFIKLLDDHYQKRQELEIQKIKLNKKLSILNSEVQKNNEKERKQCEESIKISFKISEIQKQLDYYLAKAEISESVNIDDLVILLGENLTDEYKFSQETINKIIEVGKRIGENEELALALVKIFEKISSDENHSSNKIEEVFNKLLSKISLSEESVEIIINLHQEFLINLNQNSNLLKYLHGILIENSNSKNRTKAFEILKSSKFYSNDLEYIKQIMKLEETSFQNDTTIAEDCLIQVQNRNKLTWNLFEKLTQYFPTHIDIIETIIKEVVEQNLQKLPESFIKNFQEHINSLSSVSTLSDKENQMKFIIKICKLLIKNKYLINLNKIQSHIGNLLSINTDESLQDEILGMIFIEFSNGDQIDNELIEKIKLLSDKNQYAQNIMNLIEKDSIDDNLSILKNSRNDLIKRKQALFMIVSPPINLLESLIAYEPYLRADAFKILPNDLEIDFSIIAQAIYNDENIHIEDVSKFIDKIKNKGNFSIILPAIIHRFYNDQQSEVLKLLDEISRSEEKQGEEFVEYLLNLIENTYVNQIRSQLITIIENCMANNKDLETIQIKKQKIDSDGIINEIEPSLIDELNQLKTISLIHENTFENLSKNIQQRNGIVTQNEIILLIDALVDPTKQESISDLLLQIDLTQGLDNTITTRLYEKIISNPKLIQYPSLVAIITINLNKNREVPNPIIKTLWEEFLLLPEDSSDKTKILLKQNLIYIIMLLVTQNNQIPMDVLKKLVNIFTNQQEDVQLRIVIEKFLSKSIEIISEQEVCTLVIQSLKDVALQFRNNQNEDLLNKFVFSNLRKYVDYQFLNNFYQQLKVRAGVIEDDKGIQELNKFFKEEKTPLKIFQLLNALNIQFSNSQTLDTTIFKEFHQDEWTKEILASQLIIEIFKIKQNYDEGINEFELEKFRDYIQLLTSQKNHAVEDLLEILIIKQNIDEFNLETLNDILYILVSLASVDDYEKNQIFDILQNGHADFYIQLQSIWLAKRLKYFDIKFTNENLKELNQYLPYKPETINLFFDRVNQSSQTIDELIEFFTTLANSGLTFESSQTFLINELIEKTTLEKLLIRLGEKLVGLILSKRFPFYQDYLRSKKNYKNYHLSSKKTTSRKNAYNQANTTEWYTAEDIAQITSEWMKEFNTSTEGKKLRVTQALGRQDNMSLSTILNKVIVEYKQEKDIIFIIPLNIADNHWVTAALVPDQEKNIVLYKDSLGEENLIEERDEIEKIFKAADLSNFEFKYNRSSEQVDDYNCGIFALANMKIMAKELTSLNNQKQYFIKNFEYNKNFVNQEQAVQLRKETFPKMYALSLCESFKRREIVDHHLPELKHLEELLRNKTIITTEENNQWELSIALPQEENLIENDYKYLYVIKINDTNSLNVDFTQTSDLKRKLIQGLGITEIYEENKTFVKILDENLTELNQKEKKLNPIEKVSLGDKEIEELLGQLDVDITEFNKDILRENLGLKEENNVPPSTIKNQNEIIDIQDCELLYKLHQKLTKILTCAGWLLKSIDQLLSHVNSKLKLEHLLNSLDPIYEYNLREYDQNMKGKSVFQVLMTTASQKWITEIHNLAIFQTFKGSHIKDLNELKQEIFLEEIHKQFLSDEYENIKTFYDEKRSEICPEFTIIKQWKTNEIYQWAKKLKLTRNKISHYEIIAIIKRAVEITSKFPPREIQLLSLIILLNPKKNHGRLAQINTGEGKTTIVAMLAAFKALEGHQVDIVTSSPELAKPQSEEQAKFYLLFGLTCAHNGQDSPIDIKQRYQANIVYGAAGNFQGDILRDEYSKLEIRQGRRCDVAIVDEVDSMLIDGKNHIVMLSSSMPGMDNLESLLAAIWIQIGEVTKSVKEINGKWYFIDQENALDNHGKLRSDLVEHAYCIEGTREQFIKDCTEKHIRKLIRDEDNLSPSDKENLEEYPEIKIPKHLRELVIKTQLKKWISSAIHAKYKCKNNQDYVIKNGRIAPVDASNTGIVQQNMNWNDGLHQFLQLKHGAKITPENFTTNFISNVTYFKRYSPNIFGLTGTLGSNNARELLNETYNVDSVIIPPFKQKQYKELTPIICDQEDDWYMNIVQSSMNKLRNGRGVLIITKYIQQVEEIRNRLINEGYNKEKIKIYKTEEDSMKIIQQELKHGEIIIATNIAGRGTDIRASDIIENNGGLHVCVTFLPANERVEQQNVGRTSRTGNKGTGQFILLTKNGKNDFKRLKRTRDEDEETGLQSAKTQINQVIIKDEIFTLFCKLLDDIDDSDNRLQASIEKSILKIKLRAIEERFGIWLKMEETAAFTTKTENNEMEKNFEEFKGQILNDKKNDKLIQNSYFHVLIGNEFLRIKEYDKAIEEFTKATKLDEYFQVNAFYNRGYARIAQYGNNIEHKQIVEAIEDFRKAKKIIEENFEPLLNIIQQAATDSETLSEQVTHKMTLYGIQKNTIEMAIGQDITSQIKALEKEKLERKNVTERRRKEIEQELEKKNSIEIEQLNELEKEREKQQKIMTDAEKVIDEQIKNLKENQEAKELGIIGQAKKSNRSIKIEHVEIEKSLPEDEDINLYKEEIQEYKNNGFRGSFRIKEIKPIDWEAVISVAALGITQLVSGAAIAVFSLGAGSTIGMGLIFEGVSDLITAVKDGIINRNFSWISYGIQKAISLTVSLVCAGMGAIKDAAKTAVAGVKQVASVVTKTVMTTVTKTGWRIAAKAMGTAIAKGVAKELVTQLVDYGVNKALMPSIEEEIMKLVEKPIQDALINNDKIKKMLELDGLNRKRTYEMLIKKKALELLNPQQHGGSNALVTIAEGIAKGIASNKIPGLSTMMQIKEAGDALNALVNFVPKFLEDLNQAINEIFEKEDIQKQLGDFQNKQAMNTETTTISTKQQNSQENMNENTLTRTSDYHEERQQNDIDISQSNEQEQKVGLNRESKSSDQLCQTLAGSMSTNMCNIIKNKLITPITHAGINVGMQHLSAGLDRNLQEEIGTFQAERRVEFFQDKDRNNRIPEEYKKGMKDPVAMAKVDEMIKDLDNDGEAGLPHLGSIGEEIGRPIKVLDEKGHVIRIIGEHKGGAPVEVEYHKPTADNPRGHWTLPGGKEPKVNNSGKNNCLFNVIAEQTNKDPNQLRANTVTRMENNKAILANQAFDIMRLEQYKQSALTMGGIELRGQSVYFDDKETDELIKLVESEFNGRIDAPKDLDIIKAQDDNENSVPISKHHLIPEAKIREDFKILVKSHKGDKHSLKTKLNEYINHPNNAIAKERFIKVFNLKENLKVLDRPEAVAIEIQKAVSWHPNNLRIGPDAGLRKDDPIKCKTPFEIDIPVADEKTAEVLKQYVEENNRGSQVNILETLNELPSNVEHFGWKIHNRKYKVDTTIKIGKMSLFLKLNRAQNAVFNISRCRRQQNLHP